MTIEGRPDWTEENQEFWNKTYAAQRKDRMQDAIDDYLQDDKVDPQQTYDEMLSCIQDVIDYHKKSLDRAVTLKSLMLGNREVSFDISQDYSYDLTATGEKIPRSLYYYDWDRNGKTVNPFEVPDYTELPESKKKAKTYADMIAEGFSMTDDGFWTK